MENDENQTPSESLFMQYKLLSKISEEIQSLSEDTNEMSGKKVKTLS